MISTVSPTRYLTADGFYPNLPAGNRHFYCHILVVLLLFLCQQGLAGNKARKLWSLHQRVADGSFPATVVSHGGGQSNSMLALAAVVKAANDYREHSTSKGVCGTSCSRFIYFTKVLPRCLKENPSGNYASAVALGAEVGTACVRLHQCPRLTCASLLLAICPDFPATRCRLR